MKRICCRIALVLWLNPAFVAAQTNLLLNGSFEDINTCTEYNSECGVEGWFYLSDVKAQMLENTDSIKMFGKNSFGIFTNWKEYTGFTPVIGTILPCILQKGKEYIFRGMIAASLNPKLILKPGICLGQKFYVPGRPFSKELKPDSIKSISSVPQSNFFRFEYRFVANGEEKYLTFGSYIYEDTTGAKKKLFGVQTVSLILDNFELIPADKKETVCPAYELNKKTIYGYNFRHKEMDYSLYGRGELSIAFDHPENNLTTELIEIPPVPLKTDTIRLGDVLFDFNKADLKTSAINILTDRFINNPSNNTIDSIYIEGHTDSVGTDKRNIELSLQRCKSVQEWLILNNIIIPGNSIIHPFGKSRPVATNKTPAGRALNRRVEIIIFRKIVSREP